MIHGVRRRRAVRRQQRQRETIIRILAIGVFCAVPVLAVINSSGANLLQAPLAALASTRAVGESTAQNEAVDQASGSIDIETPKNNPFNPLLQSVASAFAGGGSMNSAAPYVGTATSDRLAGKPERDPFKPLVVAYVPVPGTPSGGTTTPIPGNSYISPSPPVQGVMEVVTTFIANNQARAYFYYNGSFYDVTAGDTVNGYVVTDIDHKNGQLTMEKDGETYILAAGGSIK